MPLPAADTESTQAYSAIPDPEAQTHWATALAHLARASTACVTAVRNHDGNLIARAADEMSAVPRTCLQ